MYLPFTSTATSPTNIRSMNLLHWPLIFFSLHRPKFIAHTVIFHPNDTFAINSSKNPNERSGKEGGKMCVRGKSEQQFTQMQNYKIAVTTAATKTTTNIFVSHRCRYHFSIPCTTTSPFSYSNESIGSLTFDIRIAHTHSESFRTASFEQGS